jgi:hypothetical protein
MVTSVIVNIHGDDLPSCGPCNLLASAVACAKGVATGVAGKLDVAGISEAATDIISNTF